MDYYLVQILNSDFNEVLCTLRCSSIELTDVIISVTRSGYLVIVSSLLSDSLKEVSSLKPEDFKKILAEWK